MCFCASTTYPRYRAIMSLTSPGRSAYWSAGRWTPCSGRNSRPVPQPRFRRWVPLWSPARSGRSPKASIWRPSYRSRPAAMSRSCARSVSSAAGSPLAARLPILAWRPGGAVSCTGARVSRGRGGRTPPRTRRSRSSSLLRAARRAGARRPQAVTDGRTPRTTRPSGATP